MLSDTTSRGLRYDISVSTIVPLGRASVYCGTVVSVESRGHWPVLAGERIQEGRLTAANASFHNSLTMPLKNREKSQVGGMLSIGPIPLAKNIEAG